MPISKEDARDLAQAFLEVSHALGSYRFAHWGDLTPTQRRQIEDAEWDLLNYSGSFVTTAVGIALADMETDLKTLMDATAKAKRVVRQIQTVKAVIKIATALVVLGGAIASQNPSAILTAAGDVLKTVQAVG